MTTSVKSGRNRKDLNGNAAETTEFSEHMALEQHGRSSNSVIKNQNPSKRRSYSMAEKLEILKCLETESIHTVCTRYDLNQSLLRKWRRDKTEFKKICESGNPHKQRKNRTTGNMDVDDALYVWFLQMRASGIAISMALLQNKALALNAELGGSQSFKASNGWFYRWKMRKGISRLAVADEEFSVNKEHEDQNKFEFLDIVKHEKVTEDEVSNSDETELRYETMPNQVSVMIDENQTSNFQFENERLAIGANQNDDDLPDLALAVIDKPAPHCALKNVSMKNPPLSYKHQENLRIDPAIFTSWFKNQFINRNENLTHKKDLPMRASFIIDTYKAHSSIQVDIDRRFLKSNVSALFRSFNREIFETLTREDLTHSHKLSYRSGVKKRSSIKRRSFSMTEKLRILEYLDTESVNSVHAKFNIHESVLRKWRQKKAEFKKICQKGNLSHQKKNRVSANADVDDALYRWFLQMRANGITISMSLLQRKALELNAQLGGSTNFKGSNGWYYRWKIRQGINRLTEVDEKITVYVEPAVQCKIELPDIEEHEEMTSAEVFNSDDSTSSYNAITNETLAIKDKNQISSIKTENESLSSDADDYDGDDPTKLPLVIMNESNPPSAHEIVTMENLSMFDKYQKNVPEDNTIFIDQFKEEPVCEDENFSHKKNQPTKALLVIENCKTYSPIKINIDAESLPPNVTELIEPYDRGIFDTLNSESLSTDLYTKSSHTMAKNQNPSKRRSFLITEKLKILKCLETESVSAVCTKFNIHQSMLRKWKRQKVELKKIGQKENLRNQKRNKPAANADVDNALYEWFLQMRVSGITVTMSLLQKKALELNAEFGGSKNFKASNGWFYRWKLRKGVQQLGITDEDILANSAAEDEDKMNFSNSDEL